MAWTDEEILIQRLRKIEALFSRTDVAGERDAAAHAIEGILKQLHQRERTDTPAEYSFKLNDQWSRRLFTALLRRYGIQPYRYRGQRYTTVMARVPAPFVDEILWPEFKQLDDLLHSYQATRSPQRDTCGLPSLSDLLDNRTPKEVEFGFEAKKENKMTYSAPLTHNQWLELDEFDGKLVVWNGGVWNLEICEILFTPGSHCVILSEIVAPEYSGVVPQEINLLGKLKFNPMTDESTLVDEQDSRVYAWEDSPGYFYAPRPF